MYTETVIQTVCCQKLQLSFLQDTSVIKSYKQVLLHVCSTYLMFMGWITNQKQTLNSKSASRGLILKGLLEGGGEQGLVVLAFELLSVKLSRSRGRKKNHYVNLKMKTTQLHLWFLTKEFALPGSREQNCVINLTCYQYCPCMFTNLWPWSNCTEPHVCSSSRRNCLLVQDKRVK